MTTASESGESFVIAVVRHQYNAEISNEVCSISSGKVITAWPFSLHCLTVDPDLCSSRLHKLLRTLALLKQLNLNTGLHGHYHTVNICGSDVIPTFVL